MESAWLNTIVSVSFVSLISLIGITVLSRFDRQGGSMKFLIALAIGALLGDVVIHILPETYEELGLATAAWLIGGFAIFFMLEKVLHWRHEHVAGAGEGRVEPFGVMNLVADGLHNFIDGALVAASYLISFPIGLATTIAVILHEIPQELGDYAILRSAGFTRSKAIGWNFISALFAIVGAVVVLAAGISIDVSAQKILAFTAGGFLYIVVVLAQRLGEEVPFLRVVANLAGVGLGVALMWLVTFVE
jgi:zinc and cadmium transporter